LSGSEVVAPKKFSETRGRAASAANFVPRLAGRRFRGLGARLHGSHAAIDVLLPLLAVSFGLTAIGVVFVIVRALSGWISGW
jgi:hypothetical protein